MVQTTLLYFVIVSLVALLTLLTVVLMCTQSQKYLAPNLSKKEKILLGFSGCVAFVADTIGVGSFAVNVALAKAFRTFKDDELPFMCNAAQVLPGAVQSLFFLKAVSVDWLTLCTLVSGVCVGGVLGGRIESRVPKQMIPNIMVVCFSAIFIYLCLLQSHVLSINGFHDALRGVPLFIGFLAMIVCGGLTAFGIGLFALVQAVLLVLQVSPLLAFPIMTTAGALQQPLTTMALLKGHTGNMNKIAYISVFGVFAVLGTIPLFLSLNTGILRSILMGVLLYNIFMLAKSILQRRLTTQMAMEI